MKKKYEWKKICLICALGCLAATLTPNRSEAETMTASTSLTIVHVTEFLWGSNDLTTWPTWPTSPDPQLHPDAAGNLGLEPDGQGLLLEGVDFEPHSMAWQTSPTVYPYPVFGNGVAAMIAAVWSTDGGKTFKLGSWDYLASTTHSKGTEGGMPDCWMGTIIHTLCDRKAGECNGRNRSNLYFAEWPTPAVPGTSGCWGAAILQD